MTQGGMGLKKGEKEEGSKDAILREKYFLNDLLNDLDMTDRLDLDSSYTSKWNLIWLLNDNSQGRTFALMNSVQKFIEIQGWLLLTIFISLHDQLSSFNSIIVQMSEKRDPSNR